MEKTEKVVVEENVEAQADVVEEKDEREVLIKELEDKITNLKNEIESIKKSAADIVNRNKQIESEKKYAASDLVHKLLTPMSYFEGALKFKSDDEKFNNFLKGFDMVYNLLADALFSDGLKEIVTKIGEEFNPRIHEVTELLEVEGDETDKILEIVQKGYYYKDRVIKPVKVKVSKIKVIENNEDQTDQTSDQE